MFRGLSERMHKEMAALAPNNTKVKVVASPERKYSAWTGGSVLASIGSFQVVRLISLYQIEFNSWIRSCFVFAI